AVYTKITIVVTKVEETGAFSDDRKRAGLDAVRVSVHVQPCNTIQTPVRIEFPNLARLVLPTGQVISPKLVTVLPIVFPKQAQDGYFDFAVSSQVPLSPLVLQVGTDSSVAFGQ